LASNVVSLTCARWGSADWNVEDQMKTRHTSWSL
jgi:hypothetical protein